MSTTPVFQTAVSAEQRLQALGLRLPAPPEPFGTYAEAVQAGDLLFFGSSPKNITHTGMYIGEGQFIHDVTNGHPVVQISKLEDEPWTRLLVACRRVK